MDRHLEWIVASNGSSPQMDRRLEWIVASNGSSRQMDRHVKWVAALTGGHPHYRHAGSENDPLGIASIFVCTFPVSLPTAPLNSPMNSNIYLNGPNIGSGMEHEAGPLAGPQV